MVEMKLNMSKCSEKNEDCYPEVALFGLSSVYWVYAKERHRE